MLTGWRKLLLLGLSLVALQAVFAGPVFSQGMPVVVQTAKDADWETLHRLLSDGLQPNAVYGDGTSALHWASYHESIDSARRLLASGAEVNSTTDLGVTPLWLAAQNGNAAMVQILLQAGADPNIALYSGETVVMTAAQSGNADVEIGRASCRERV